MARGSSPGQRRPYSRLSPAEKRRIVELALRDGSSHRAIAAAHGISRQSLRNWIAVYRAGNLKASQATFLPVTIAAPAMPVEPTASHRSVVQIALPSGVAVRIESGVPAVELVCALVERLQ